MHTLKCVPNSTAYEKQLENKGQPRSLPNMKFTNSGEPGRHPGNCLGKQRRKRERAGQSRMPSFKRGDGKTNTKRKCKNNIRNPVDLKSVSQFKIPLKAACSITSGKRLATISSTASPSLAEF